VPRLQFNIKFHTQYGQELLIMGNTPSLGNLKREAAIPMRYLNKELWQLEIDIPLRGKNTQIQYKYLLKNQDGSLLSEWGNDRIVTLHSANPTCFLYDTWNHAGDFENAFFTTPFQEVLLIKQKSIAKKNTVGSHVFRVKAPLLKGSQQVCLLGNAASLGTWSITQPVLLHKRKNWWEIAVDINAEKFPIQYKYGIWDINLFNLKKAIIDCSQIY